MPDMTPTPLVVARTGKNNKNVVFKRKFATKWYIKKTKMGVDTKG